MIRPAAGSLRAGAAALLVLAVVSGLAASTRPARADSSRADANPAAAPAGSAILIIGVPDLRWDDLSAGGTPALWQLARRGATGALVVRGADERTPPLDGWATLSAGNRARGAVGTAASRRRSAGLLTGAQVGAFGSALAAAGRCAEPAGGDGARLAAAQRTGRIDVPAGGCAVRIEEIDQLIAGRQPRPDALGAVDAAVAEATRDAGRGTTVLLLGVSDGPTGAAHLHVAIATGPGFAPGTRLRSASTRRTPFVQLVDVAPTALSRLGVAVPAGMIGQPIEARGPASADLGARRAAYLDLDRHARQMHRAVPVFFVPVVLVLVLGLGIAAALGGQGRRRTARAVGYAVAAAPVGAYLAELVPWWRGPVALVWPAAVAGGALALGAAVLLARWARRIPSTGLGVVVALSAVTFAVVVADLLTGAHLQLSSVPGYDPLIAGRFAGIGNPGFGVLAAATLVTAGLLGRSWPAVVAVGLVGVLVDGAPAFGSDVGGVLALVPGVALLALAAAGRRVTWRTTATAIGAAVAAVAAFAALDLARPADARTHLGRFASDLLHGHAGMTLHRKLVADVDLLTRNVATLLVPFLIVGLGLVALRAGRIRGTSGLAAAYQRVPALRPTLVACLVTGVLGFLLNDSGVAVPAVMMLIAVPVAVVAATDATQVGKGEAARAGR